MSNSSWSSIPRELLLDVFSRFRYETAELASFRLVCKAWNPAAEQVLLHSLHSYYEKKPFLKLHDYLAKRPSAARHIKSLKLYYYDTGVDIETSIDTAYLQKLFPLLITPSITSISGTFSPTAIALLWDIMANSPIPFNNIKELPVQRKYNKPYCENYFFYDETYIKLLLHCKDTLESLHLQINPEPGMLDHVIELLDNLKHLKKMEITFEKNYDYKEGVEDVMNHCHYVKELHLGSDQMPNVWSSSKAEARRWMRKENVQQHCSVEKIDDHLATADLVEYYIYKFPSLKELSLMYSSGSDDDDAIRILDAVKHVDKIHLTNFDLEKPATVRRFVSALKCQRNKFSLFLRGWSDSIRRQAIMDCDKNRQTEESDITMTVPQFMQPSTFKKYVSCLGKVTDMSVYNYDNPEYSSDCESIFDEFSMEKPVEFQAILRLLPHIEKLQFRVDSISNKSTDTRKASLNKLHTLNLIGAKIDEEILDFLQRSAPHLSNLTLKNSLLISKTSPYQRIRMPKIAFSTLSIITKSDSLDRTQSKRLPEDSIHGRWIKTEAPQTSMLLQVTTWVTKHPVVQHFVLSVGNKSTAACKSISKQAFDENPNSCPVLEIECKSLCMLKFDLGALVLDMKFNPGGELENAIAFFTLTPLFLSVFLNMTACWRKLPTEVWINIFTRVRNKKTLIECRRTCREWDPLAERAMFSGTFVIPTYGLKLAARLKQLHQHVSRKPTLGRHPREIRINGLGLGNQGDLVMSLLKLLVNSNTISITCDGHFSQEMFDTLYKMLQQPPLNACKFKMIPRSTCTEQYWETLCKFKDTLQDANLDLDLIAGYGLGDGAYDQLKNFKSLKSLEFSKRRFGSILELDDFLSILPQLETLTATIDFTEGEYVSKSTAELKTWFAEQNIAKNDSLKELVLCCEPEFRYLNNLIEYLMFKYPNLETLKLDDIDAIDDLDHLLTAIKHVPFKDIRYCSLYDDETAGLSKVIQHTMASENDVYISYAYPDGGGSAEISYVRFKCLYPEHHFNIDITNDTTSIDHIEILSQFATADTLHVNVRVRSRRLWGQFHGAPLQYSMYDVLKTIPHAQNISYEDMHIKYQKLDAGSLILRDLTKLFLSEADLDIRVLSQISNIAPNLQTLSITSCRLLHGSKALKNLYQFDMQFTSFALLEICYCIQLSMAAESDNEELAGERHIEGIHDACIVNGPAFLCIQTSNAGLSQEEHFYMLMNKAPAFPLSIEEFKMHCKTTSTVFRITCRSLERFKVNLIGLAVDLKFDKHYNLTNGNWSCLQKKLDAA
ncbi:hypothetical protein MBANPS3_000661 [Mucor bainieri]